MPFPFFRRRAPGRPKAARSLAARLSLLYGCSAFGLLLLVSVGMYALLAYTLDRENREQALALLDAVIDGVDEYEDLFHVSRIGPQPTQAYWTRVLDSDLHVLSRSEGLPSLPLPDPAVKTPVLSRREDPRHPMLIATGWTQPLPARPYLLQIGVDVGDDERLLRFYRKVLFGVMAACLAGSVGIGILVARRGLRPLGEIVRATERIDANQLHERLHIDEWPRELTDLASAFNRMLGRLDRAFQRLSRVSSDLAHELRTPLNNLIGEAEVTLSRERDPATYRQVIGSSLEECQRLSRIVDTLLFVARLDNPQKRPAMEILDGAHELGKIVEFFEPLAAEKDVSLTLRGDGPVHANPTLFGQAVHNLLSNALQHTTERGAVLIDLRSEPGGSVVTVTDNGRGIPANELADVFERFYRTETSRASRLPGSGLGLSIVRSIMEWHGGWARISSVEGRGTSVVLEFPAA